MCLGLGRQKQVLWLTVTETACATTHVAKCWRGWHCFQEGAAPQEAHKQKQSCLQGLQPIVAIGGTSTMISNLMKPLPPDCTWPKIHPRTKEFLETSLAHRSHSRGRKHTAISKDLLSQTMGSLHKGCWESKNQLNR